MDSYKNVIHFSTDQGCLIMNHIKGSMSPFILLFSLFLWFPTTVCAEQILAAIITADLPRYEQAHETMLKILSAGGFDQSKLKVFLQKPNADKMSLANSLRRCEAAGATLVVTYGSQATQVAQQELKNTPLLFADVYDPVSLGVVKSLQAPGSNATGAVSKTDLGQLVDQLLKIKQVKKVGVLYTKGETGSEQQLAELKARAQLAGISVVEEDAKNPEEAVALGQKLAEQCEALFLTESVSVAQKALEILRNATAKKCLTFSQIPGLVKEGALLGLEADVEEQGKLVAVYSLQVLMGQKAHILPVQLAKKISLNINTTVAANLGLTIPQDVATAAKLQN